jgi:hypothetical protein
VKEIKKKTKKDRYKDKKPNFNYPRYPKGQAYVERMNRTLQEEFVMYYKDYKLEDIYELIKRCCNICFCDIINSSKSEFSQTGMTYTISIY